MFVLGVDVTELSVSLLSQRCALCLFALAMFGDKMASRCHLPRVRVILSLQAYDIPYQAEPEANLALYETMDKLDWKSLLARVDEGYRTWRNDSVVLYGNKVCVV